MLEDRLHNFDDIVFSCFLPDDWLNEFRMPQHVLVYVYAGFLIKRTFMIHHTMRIVWWNPPLKPSRKNCSTTSITHSAPSATKTMTAKPFFALCVMRVSACTYYAAISRKRKRRRVVLKFVSCISSSYISTRSWRY